MLKNYYLDNLKTDKKLYWWAEDLTEENGYNKNVISEIKQSTKKLGFDPRELSELYLSLAVHIFPRLCEFREMVNNENIGCPANMETYMWGDILDKIIWSFEEIVTGRWDKEEISREEFPIYMTASEYDTKVKEGLQLFGKYFLYFWI